MEVLQCNLNIKNIWMINLLTYGGTKQTWLDYLDYLVHVVIFMDFEFEPFSQFFTYFQNQKRFENFGPFKSTRPVDSKINKQSM